MPELSARAISAAQAAVVRELREALDEAEIVYAGDNEWIEQTAQNVTTAAVMAIEETG